MKNTILLLTDFSQHARNAIYYALSAFHPDEYQYILLHCYPRIMTTSDVTISLSERMRQETYASLEAEATVIRNHTGLSIHFEKMAYLGFLNEAVNYVAKEKHPDLVVMGTKGETGLPAILLGSHASSLIKATNIPLLIVPENATFKGLKEIVLAADLKTLGKPEHLEPLSELADMFGSRLTVVNVIKDDSVERVDESQESEALEKEFTENQIVFRHVHDHSIEHGIAQYVHDNPCDLLVVVERSRSFVVDLFHRSVSKNLALHAETPLLILHA
ncbi:MAG: universal stress protein [Saprospiraceae bacterium]|nr:universal stress protein [Saprospiraceae bacterium]